MACQACQNIVEREDIPHVIRKCSSCGREMHVHEPGDHGRGMRIRDGDRPVVPLEWMKPSLNPLKSKVRLYRPGLDMLAENLFVDGLCGNEETFDEYAARLERQMDHIVNAFPPLSGLDINNEQDNETILNIIQNHRTTREFWAYWTGQFLAIARVARAERNVQRAAWATACAERCRGMMLFKEELEEVVWMGHSVKRILDILQVWEVQKSNRDEEFWQITFKEHSYVLSQVFAVPVVFIKDKAYVGGMQVNRSEGKFVDYLFSEESSGEAILVEIKRA